MEVWALFFSECLNGGGVYFVISLENKPTHFTRKICSLYQCCTVNSHLFELMPIPFLEACFL